MPKFIKKNGQNKFKKNGNGSAIPGNGNRGRPFKYDHLRYPKMALVVCSEAGATDKVLAKLFDVAPQTIDLWKRKHPDFKEALKKGKTNHDSGRVINALLRSAIGYKFKEVKTEEIEIVQGNGKNKISVPGIKKTITIKRNPPNPTSIIYWLNNRDRENWKNYRAVEITGNVNHKHLAMLGKLEDMPKHLEKKQIEELSTQLRRNLERNSE